MLLPTRLARICIEVLSGTISALERTRDFGSLTLDGMIEACRGFLTVLGHMFQLRGVDGISFGSGLLGGSNLGTTFGFGESRKDLLSRSPAVEQGLSCFCSRSEALYLFFGLDSMT